MLWGWPYRFEAYTPAAKRTLGYYALPMLWRDVVVGWANLALKGNELDATFGYVGSRPPRDRTFKRELEAEMERMRTFLRQPLGEPGSGIPPPDKCPLLAAGLGSADRTTIRFLP